MNKYSSIVIAIVVLSTLAGELDVVPPPAFLKVDGNEQTSGIGSYCWTETANGETAKGLCADYVGIITARDPLLVISPFTAHLRFSLQKPPEDAGLRVIRVTDEDELKGGTNESRSWRFKEGNYSRLPEKRESDINLSLDPGMYVLEINARWTENGGASYGFLLKVNYPKPEVTTPAPNVPDNMTLPENKTTKKSAPAFEIANAVLFIAITFFLLRGK